MISLRKLLDPKTPQKVCLRTFDMLLEGLEPAMIVEKLRSEGYTERMAARAVTFLPSAFAQAHYEKEGMEFPGHFYPSIEAYRKGRFRRYADEPVFQSARQLAQQLRRDGDIPQVWKLIVHSAEYRGITQAISSGLTPTGSSLLIYEF